MDIDGGPWEASEGFTLHIDPTEMETSQGGPVEQLKTHTGTPMFQRRQQNGST